MKLGTRSLIFGAHCIPIHTTLAALAWWKLFGFPWDLRLWCAFLLHDIGYLGSPEMDGPIGKRHPEAGAALMGYLFGPEWASFTIRHSRSYAKMEKLPVSALCAADKLATALVPLWLYLLQVTLSGEAEEYVALNADSGAYEPGDVRGWAVFIQKLFREEAYRIVGDLAGTPLTPVDIIEEVSLEQ